MSDDAVLTINEPALALVRELRAEEDDGDMLALWVEVVGIDGTDFAYDMYFASLDDQGPDDVVVRYDDLAVIVPAGSVGKLTGATLDLDNDELVMLNPNRPSEALLSGGSIKGDLTSPTAQRILQLIEEQINPAIASHGGACELISVESDVAYVKLAGGCQGCGMAAVTLRQGIEVTIREFVPEIVQVVDVTDHASGDNPYYSHSH